MHLSKCMQHYSLTSPALQYMHARLSPDHLCATYLMRCLTGCALGCRSESGCRSSFPPPHKDPLRSTPPLQAAAPHCPQSMTTPRRVLLPLEGAVVRNRIAQYRQWLNKCVVARTKYTLVSWQDRNATNCSVWRIVLASCAEASNMLLLVE
jgi:hypothetical protein